MVSGDYLAVSGGKEAERDKGTKQLTIDSIKGKGNFFKIDGQLVSYTDWEQIAHNKDMNEQDQSKAGYDHVFSYYAREQDALEQELVRLPEDNAQRAKKIAELRRNHLYFLISDEGELFSQEGL